LRAAPVDGRDPAFRSLSLHAWGEEATATNPDLASLASAHGPGHRAERNVELDRDNL
jgi:hypothetical protein